MKHSYETETWIRIYRSHVKYLLAYETKRGMKTDITAKAAADKMAAIAKEAAKQKKIDEEAKKAALAWKAKSKIGGSKNNLVDEGRDKTPPPMERDDTNKTPPPPSGTSNSKNAKHPGSPDAPPLLPPLETTDETTKTKKKIVGALQTTDETTKTKKKIVGAFGAIIDEIPETPPAADLKSKKKKNVSKEESNAPVPAPTPAPAPAPAPVPVPAAEKPKIDLKALKNKGSAAPPPKKGPAKPKFTSDIEPASDDEDKLF